MLSGLWHHIRVYNRQFARIFLRYCTVALTLATISSLAQSTCFHCYCHNWHIGHKCHTRLCSPSVRDRGTHSTGTDMSILILWWYGNWQFFSSWFHKHFTTFSQANLRIRNYFITVQYRDKTQNELIFTEQANIYCCVIHW